MNKLTAGIFAGILTVVAVNAAHADIATTNYVKGAIQSLDSSVADGDGVISTITVTDGKIADTQRRKIENKDIADGAAIAVSKISGAQTIANIVAEGNAEGKFTEAQLTDKTAYPSMNAAAQIATQIAQAKLTEVNINGLTASVATLEKNLEDAIGQHEDDIGNLKDLVGSETVDSQIDTKINALDVASVGGSGNVIKSISQENGKIVATAGKVAEADLDTTLANKINGKLDTSTTTVADGKSIKAANTVAQNLKALDDQVDANKIAIAANADKIETLTGTGEGSVTKQIETLQTTVKETTDGLNERLTTAEGEIDVLQAATTGYNATNTVAAAVADAKKAGTDAAAALTTYQGTQATKDSSQDSKITALEEKVGNNNVSTELAKKMDLATGTQNKLLTTDAKGQVIAATATGTCTPGDGISCMMVSDGAGGFRMESVVDKWTD